MRWSSILSGARGRRGPVPYLVPILAVALVACGGSPGQATDAAVEATAGPGPISAADDAATAAADGDDDAADADAGQEAYSLRIGATSVTGTPAGSLGWGDKEGILAEELAAAGVTDIEYAFFQSGTDAVSALLSGAVDVASVGDNPTLTAKGNGADIALLALDSVGGDTWVIGAKDGPTTFDGLVGKAVTAPQGTIRDRAAHQLIEENGLTGQVDVLDVPTPESIAALISGGVDATLVGGTGAVDLEQQGFPVLDKTSNHGLGSVGTAIAERAFVDEHPGFVEAWQSAVVATNVHILDNLDDYNAWVAETDDVALELVEVATDPATFNTEAFPEDGLAELQRAYEFLVSDGTIAEEYDLQAWAEETS